MIRWSWIRVVALFLGSALVPGCGLFQREPDVHLPPDRTVEELTAQIQEPDPDFMERVHDAEESLEGWFEYRRQVWELYPPDLRAWIESDLSLEAQAAHVRIDPRADYTTVSSYSSGHLGYSFAYYPEEYGGRVVEMIEFVQELEREYLEEGNDDIEPLLHDAYLELWVDLAIKQSSSNEMHPVHARIVDTDGEDVVDQRVFYIPRFYHRVIHSPRASQRQRVRAASKWDEFDELGSPARQRMDAGKYVLQARDVAGRPGALVHVAVDGEHGRVDLRAVR